MTESRGDRVVRRIVGWLPKPLAVAPERVIINFACILIGVTALTAARPGSLQELWPWWVAYEWAAAMIIGGACALIGHWKNARSVERLGYMLIGAAATIYAVAVLYVFGWQGIFSALIYAGIAFSKLVRLLVGSLARSTVIRAGRHAEGWNP